MGFSGLSGLSGLPLDGNYRRLSATSPCCPSVHTHSSNGLRECTGSQGTSSSIISGTVSVVAAPKGLSLKLPSTTCLRKALLIAIDCNEGAALALEGWTTGSLTSPLPPENPENSEYSNFSVQRASRRFGTGPPSGEFCTENNQHTAPETEPTCSSRDNDDRTIRYFAPYPGDGNAQAALESWISSSSCSQLDGGCDGAGKRPKGCCLAAQGSARPSGGGLQSR